MPIREGRYLDNHIKRCAELPTAEELIALLEADVANNVRTMAKSIGVGDDRIRGIILTAGDEKWDREALNARGLLAKKSAATRVRVRKRRTRGRSKCGHCELLLDDDEKELCKFCRMKAAGLLSRTDVEKMNEDDSRWAIVRQRDLVSRQDLPEAAP
jgi:hypothetical protein